MQAVSDSKPFNMIGGLDCNLKSTELSPTSQDKQSQICQYVAKIHLCDCSLPEQWKELRDHPLYFLCCDGNVVSYKTKAGPHLLKPYYNRKSGCLSHSFGLKTKSTAKLVLEHFHPSFLEIGGEIKYKDKNRANTKLDNLTFEPFEEPGEKAFWDVYVKTRWDRDDLFEEYVKPYFDHILDSDSVKTFCEKYKATDIPTHDQLCQMLEQGWIHRYGERHHFHREIPLSQTKQLLKYLIKRATAEVPFTDETPVTKTLKRQKRV